MSPEPTFSFDAHLDAMNPRCAFFYKHGTQPDTQPVYAPAEIVATQLEEQAARLRQQIAVAEDRLQRKLAQAKGPVERGEFGSHVNPMTRGT